MGQERGHRGAQLRVELAPADQPGVAKPIKLQAQHRELVPLDKPLTAQTGSALARWATGPTAAVDPAIEAEADSLAEQLLGMSSDKTKALEAINRQREQLDLGQFIAWANGQAKRAA